MTKSTITRERLSDILEFGSGRLIKPISDEEIELMARMALAAMNGEPFAYIIQDKYERERGVEGHLSRSHVSKYVSQEDINEHEITCTPLYRHAQMVPERDQVRQEHAEWSQATFGNVGPIGPLKHLSKEALEAAEQPGDLSEWADMQFLLWDAQRRAGVTDEQITQAMIEKLAVNKQREWPEPKDGEPRLHIKEQPAPVFPDFDNVLESLDYEARCNAWESEHVLKACQATYDAFRAAMLQTQSDDDGEPTDDERIMAIEGIHSCERCGDEGWFVGEMGITRCACGQIGNSPANPGCWCRTCRPVAINDMRFVVCPDCGNKRCPRANDHRNSCTGSNEPGQEGSAYPADPQEVPDGK